MSLGKFEAPDAGSLLCFAEDKASVHLSEDKSSSSAKETNDTHRGNVREGTVVAASTTSGGRGGRPPIS